MELLIEEVSKSIHAADQLTLPKFQRWCQFSNALKENVTDAKKMMTSLYQEDPQTLENSYKACGILAYGAVKNFQRSSSHPDWFCFSLEELTFAMMCPGIHASNFKDFFSYVKRLIPQLVQIHDAATSRSIEAHVESVLHLLQCSSYANVFSKSQLATMAQTCFPSVAGDGEAELPSSPLTFRLPSLRGSAPRWTCGENA